MEYPKKALGVMLRHNRIDQNISLRTLAQRTGISAMYLSDVENGVQRPADYTLRKLFSELALPYDPDLIWQSDFSLAPLYQAILDFRMEVRDQLAEQLNARRESLMASCHCAQFLLARWIVQVSRGENRSAETLALKASLMQMEAGLEGTDLCWYQLYLGIHEKALDEVESALHWLIQAAKSGQDEGVKALIDYHHADCLIRLHQPQSALLMNQRALDQFSHDGYFVRAIHTRIHQIDLFLNDEPAHAQALALRVRQEAEQFQCPHARLMAEERLALAALLLNQPEAALAHAQACVEVIHRPALLICGALAAYQCHRPEECQFFINRGMAECRRKKQTDTTFRWIEALLHQDLKQLIQFSLQPDPLAGPLQKKLLLLRFQTLVEAGETQMASTLIQQACL